MASRNPTARKGAPKQPTERRERTGSIGPQGPPGPPGAPGPNHTGEIMMLKAQVDRLVREFQTQLTRIGQLQAQLDHVQSGQASKPHNRRSTDHTEH